MNPKTPHVACKDNRKRRQDYAKVITLAGHLPISLLRQLAVYFIHKRVGTIKKLKVGNDFQLKNKSGMPKHTGRNIQKQTPSFRSTPQY